MKVSDSYDEIIPLTISSDVSSTNKMIKLHLFLALFFFPSIIIVQHDSIRSATHIFWSKEYQVQISDFQDTTKSVKNLENCEKYNLCWGAYLGLFSALDQPQKKSDKKKKEEVVYFAPAFEVKTSY